ncbi:hypothetical protein [Pigmentiphaga daeguensis]|uniref:Uncharacterized protein n=1 Tax=Pigmentiphaga daeguensis TaxID=414049 RepID=A0ABN1D5W3_9BURK
MSSTNPFKNLTPAQLEKAMSEGLSKLLGSPVHVSIDGLSYHDSEDFMDRNRLAISSVVLEKEPNYS